MAQYSETQIVRKPICPTVKCCKIYLCNYHQNLKLLGLGVEGFWLTEVIISKVEE